MKLTVLALLLAASLQAGTILPGSWIEAYDQGSGQSMRLNLQADDGFYIVGGGSGWVQNSHDGFYQNVSVDFDWEAGGGDAWVTSVSPPWVPGDGLSIVADTAYFYMSAPETPLANGSAPFTFRGTLESSGQPMGSPVHPLFYEFSGQGTAYFNVVPG